jgi:hypothetical protein
MLKRIPLFLAALLPLFTHAAWIDASGKQLPETESMRSSGDFGVQLVLTPDEKRFRQAWFQEGTPRLQSVDAIKIGSSASAMLLFHGCSPNPAGACDVVAEFALESPDGARTSAGNGPVWSSAPSPGLMQLGLASMTVGFDPTDLVGEYKLIANVRDNVSGRTLLLTARLKVAK